MRDVADTEGDTDRNRQLVDGAVGLGQQDRKMPGRGGGHLLLAGVDDQVAARDELPGQVADDGVQGVHQLPGRHARSGQGVGRGPQPPHDDGRLQAAAHHVADQHPGASGPERDEVEPVAADAPGRGQVPARRLQPGNLGQGPHQAALKGERDVALLPVQTGQFLLGSPVLADVPHDRAGADDRARPRAHRIQQDVHVQQVSGAGPAQRLVVVDLLAAPDGRQQRVDLLLVSGRGQHRHVPADRLGGGVAVHARRGGVPERDRPVEGLGQDGVLRGFDDQCQFADAFLGGSALAHIADRRRDQEPFARLQRAQADLDRELAAIAAQPAQLQARAHGPDLLVGGVAPAVPGVFAAEPLGHQDLDRAAEQFPAPVAEQRLGLGVDQPDRSGAVDDHHRVGRRLQQGAERLPGVGRLACRGTRSANGRCCSGPHAPVAAPGGHDLTLPPGRESTRAMTSRSSSRPPGRPRTGPRCPAHPCHRSCWFPPGRARRDLMQQQCS